MDIGEFQKTQVVVGNLSGSPFSKVAKLQSKTVVITGPILNFICQNRRDPEILVCYKEIERIKLRVAVWLAPKKKKGFHNSILSLE